MSKNVQLQKLIEKDFPWYDSSYLMEMMLTWLEYAEPHYKNNCMSAKGERISHKICIMKNLLKRILDGDDLYYKMTEHLFDNSKYFTIQDITQIANNGGTRMSAILISPSENEYKKRLKFRYKRTDALKEQDLKLFGELFKKHILHIWD